MPWQALLCPRLRHRRQRQALVHPVLLVRAKKKGFLSRCQTRHSPSSSSAKSMAIRHHSQPAWALGSCSCVFPTAINVVQTPFAVFPSPATSMTGVPSSSDSNFPPRHSGTGRRGRVSACPLHATARRHPRCRPKVRRAPSRSLKTPRPPISIDTPGVCCAMKGSRSA